MSAAKPLESSVIYSDGTVDLHYRCMICGKVAEVKGVQQEAWEAWRRGFGTAQTVFPHLSADERETLMSGTHGECFDSLYPADGEDDD